MGFHKRYIDDDQIIRIYRNEGCQAVIDWFSKGVDAVILSGELAETVHTMLNILEHDHGWHDKLVCRSDDAGISQPRGRSQGTTKTPDEDEILQ